jgi:phage terminase large subunit-like protein
MARKRKAHAAPEFWFDETAADMAVAFFERFLVHIEGEWAGEPFILLPWQRDEIIRPLFGWKRGDGTRKYRYAYIEIPRKNGKSTLAAGIALYLTFADEEPGAKVFGCAGDREQAAVVFETAKAMVEESPKLLERCDLFRRSMVVPASRSVYQVLSAEAYSKHGKNTHGVIFDEFHVQQDRELWDTMTTSTGARRQPLVVAITTAGYDRESICWEQHEYARKVLEGVIEDPSFFAYIRAAGDDEDWLDEEVWKRCNPSLGVTVKLDYLRAEANRARQVPAYQNTFRRLHLNQWTSQQTRWLPMEAWEQCAHPVDPEAMGARQAYGGLDLASAIDVAAFSLAFEPPDLPEGGDPGPIPTLHWFWIPEENLIERARRDRVPYDAWVRDKWITATPGNVIDYEWIIRDITQLGQQFNIQEIAFDRWGAFQISQRLEGAGFTMVAFGQGFVSMSAPTKELLRLTVDHKLAHGGNPVLRWMADNLVVTQDAAGNVKPDKKKSREKIDGVVSTIMAIDRLSRHGGTESVYETRGLLEI